MEEIEDFSEFKYKENLHLQVRYTPLHLPNFIFIYLFKTFFCGIQLGNTCVHLVSLAEASDMASLSDILASKYSVILATLDFLHSKV
jgi:hypothetical protein